MQKNRPQSARFIVIFIAVLLLISAGVYWTFSHFAQSSHEQHDEVSRQNLVAIGAALMTYLKQHAGEWPDESSKLFDSGKLSEQNAQQPAWPEQPGYMFVSRIQPKSDAAETIAVFENVPERKRKLGIQTLFVDGRIERLSEVDFTRRLTEQEQRWQKQNRVWRLEPLQPKRNLDLK